MDHRLVGYVKEQQTFFIYQMLDHEAFVHVERLRVTTVHVRVCALSIIVKSSNCSWTWIDRIVFVVASSCAAPWSTWTMSRRSMVCFSVPLRNEVNHTPLRIFLVSLFYYLFILFLFLVFFKMVRTNEPGQVHVKQACLK